jgi:lipid-binding SYLF domain-containing protein
MMLNLVEKLSSSSAPRRAYRRLKKTVRGPIEALRKEATMGPALHSEVTAALQRMTEANTELEKVLSESYAFAVIPSIGKAAAVVGGAFGKGEVFRRGRVVGYTALIQLTIGVQLGGETLHMVVAFRDKNAFKQFKQGSVKFAAAASVALVKSGADAARAFGSGTSVFLVSEGGLLVQASIGGQKLIYRKAALGRTRGLEGDGGDSPDQERGNGRDDDELASAAEQDEGDGADEGEDEEETGEGEYSDAGGEDGEEEEDEEDDEEEEDADEEDADEEDADEEDEEDDEEDAEEEEEDEEDEDDADDDGDEEEEEEDDAEEEEEEEDEDEDEDEDT